jgi:hypothetical protein
MRNSSESTLFDETNTGTDLSEATPDAAYEFEGDDLRIIADCKLWRINTDGELSVMTENEILCRTYATSQVLKGDARFVTGFPPDDRENKNTIIIDLENSEGGQ